MSKDIDREDQIGARLSESELCPEELLREQELAFERDIAKLKARLDEFVRVSCPACSSDHFVPAFQKYSFEFQSCTICQTIFMSPRPSEDIMASYYANSENYAYWAKYIFPASEDTRREKIHKPWLKRVLQYCRQFKISTKTLLEVGPGFGTFSSVATESGAFDRVVAVEPTPELAAACRERGVEVIQSRIEEIESQVRDIDVVVAFEVIEHLYDPGVFLEAIKPCMSPNGLLVLSCPNGLGFDISILKAKSLAVDVEHVNLFNPASLSLLLRSMGYEVLKVHTPGRLDAEFVREAALKNEISLDSFLQKCLIDEWDTLGWALQQFLAENGLSSHMWLAAQKVQE